MPSDTRKIRLLLLPGLHGTAGLFEAFLETCPPLFEPSVLAFPGDVVLSYERLEEFVCERIASSGPLVLLGESFSGPLALRLAARKPDGLVGVILVASFIRSPAPRWVRHLPWRLMFGVSRPLYTLRALLAGGSAEASVLRQIRHELDMVSPAVLAGRLQEIFAVDATDALRRCPVPILYLSGARDRIVRKNSLRRILELRPDVMSFDVPAKHFVLQVAPRESWSAMTRFVHEKCTTEPCD